MTRIRRLCWAWRTRRAIRKLKPGTLTVSGFTDFDTSTVRVVENDDGTARIELFDPINGDNSIPHPTGFITREQLTGDDHGGAA